MQESAVKINLRFISLSILVCLTSLLHSCNYAQQTDLRPGKERWTIKTSIPDNTQQKSIALKNLLHLPEPITTYSHKRYDENRIEDSVEYKGKYYKEGDIITTTGYIHVVALEKDGNKRDGDYHIQILPGKDWADSCLIVEVPYPEFIMDDSTLKVKVNNARNFIYEKVLKGKNLETKGKALIPPVHVKISGQLFFDGVHLNSGTLRGKSVGNVKNKMHSYTCWEIHPVTFLEEVKE